MSESRVFWPPENYTMLSFEESTGATIVELEDDHGTAYRITAPFIAPDAEHYADLGTWTLERRTGGGVWQPVAFTTPDNAGEANDTMRVWTEEFRQLREASEEIGDEDEDE